MAGLKINYIKFWSHFDLAKLAGKITHECGSLSFPCFSNELEGFSWQLTWFTGSHDGALLDIFRDDVVKCTCKTVPLGSMYGIFSYIWLIFMVNAGKYFHTCMDGMGRSTSKNAPRSCLVTFVAPSNGSSQIKVFPGWLWKTFGCPCWFKNRTKQNTLWCRHHRR